jgi:DNA-binding PadR family transcriptional regulator
VNSAGLQAVAEPTAPPRFRRTAFAPVVEPRTYSRFAYLALGLPLATACFSYVIAMLATSAGLLVTLLGLPLLGLTLVTARALAALDCRLAEALLGVEMPQIAAVRPRGDSFWHTVKLRLFDREAWTDCAYLLLRFPLAVFTFTMAVSFVGSALWMIGQPLLVAVGVHSDFGNWRVDSMSRALLFVAPGIVLLFVSFHVVDLLADLSARFARGMVGRVGQGELRRAIARLLGHDRRLDGGAILRELRLYHGYSADFTVANVYTTLLGLEDLGLVETEETDDVAVYSLTQPGADALAEALSATETRSHSTRRSIL